jgi:aryl-alcohol dehydrogenase-like predicted oxidoreductase
MQYRLFGRSGLRVSQLCLGTMTFGEGWGNFSAGKEESQRIFHAFVDAGGNFIDTANGYMDGQSEELVGQLISSMRDRIVLATKFGFNVGQNDPNAGGGHRKNLVQSVEASLRRLKTDYIDLYWMHLWDATTHLDELMRALDDQVRAGKILYVGFSDAPAWVVSRAHTLAEVRGWTPFCGLQIQYNLIERTVERELIPMAQALDLGIAAWSPLASGVLAGKRSNGATSKDDVRAQLAQRYAGERTNAIVAEVSRIANARGTAPGVVALAWLAQQGKNIFPILGATTLSQFSENLKCVDVVLSPEELQRLRDASAFELGFPNDFLTAVRKGEMPGGLWGVSVDRVDYATVTRA